MIPISGQEQWGLIVRKDRVNFDPFVQKLKNLFGMTIESGPFELWDFLVLLEKRYLRRDSFGCG